MGKRGRPAGSKNKKVFQCDTLAQKFAETFIASYHIESAEQLATKILEKIRANRKRLTDTSPNTSPDKGRETTQPRPPVPCRTIDKGEL